MESGRPRPVVRLQKWFRRYRWVFGRLAAGALTLWAVSIIIFAATMLLPGDAAVAILGNTASPERLDALRAELGLDQSFVSQYVEWVGGFVRGDFGTSIVGGADVGDMLGVRLANTAVLVALTAVIGFPISMTLGVVAAIRRGGVIDSIVNVMSVVISALPEFVIGLFLVMLFATTVFQVFPAVSLVAGNSSTLSDPVVLILPTATLVIAILPYMARQVRAAMIDVLDSDYIAMAELKGLKRRHVILRHALPNSVTAAIQVGALTIAVLFAGTVIIEFLFQYPGVGTSLALAVEQRDVPVVQFIVMVFATVYVVANLVADVATVLVTPKLRTK
ncbi:ABC transporter permease [Nocardioides sp. AN3]